MIRMDKSTGQTGLMGVSFFVGENYIGDSCTVDSNCVTLHSECRKETCECQFGYGFSPRTHECQAGIHFSQIFHITIFCIPVLP